MHKIDRWGAPDGGQGALKSFSRTDPHSTRERFLDPPDMWAQRSAQPVLAAALGPESVLA